MKGVVKRGGALLKGTLEVLSIKSSNILTMRNSSLSSANIILKLEILKLQENYIR